MDEKKDKKKEKQDMNSGHRERVTESIMERGYSTYADYQLLETLLFYAIPRRDVKPIAKRLLEKFGTFDSIFSKPPEVLITVEGVGVKTAVYLNVIGGVVKRLNDHNCKEYVTIDSFDTAINFFMDMYRADNEVEKFAAVFLDNSNKIKHYCFISDGTADSVSVNIRKFMELALSTGAASVIIAHNHPGGEAFPSCEDVDFTINLLNVLESVHVYLADHIVLNEKEGFSMHSSINYVEIFDRKSNNRNNPKPFHS